MIYVKSLIGLAGGSATSPTRTDLYVTSGLIYQVELYFPPGSSGLLHVAVFDGSFPLWPSSNGETFSGDNTLISFPDRYFVDSPRKALTVVYYNEDDMFDHGFQLRVGQVSAEVFIASFLPSVTMDKLTEQLKVAGAAQKMASAASMEDALSTFDRYGD